MKGSAQCAAAAAYRLQDLHLDRGADQLPDEEELPGLTISKEGS